MSYQEITLDEDRGVCLTLADGRQVTLAFHDQTIASAVRLRVDAPPGVRVVREPAVVQPVTSLWADEAWGVWLRAVWPGGEVTNRSLGFVESAHWRCPAALAGALGAIEADYRLAVGQHAEASPWTGR